MLVRQRISAYIFPKEAKNTTMINISHLTINSTQENLQITFEPENNCQYSFEYLRAFSPVKEKESVQIGNFSCVFHKKQVKLLNIEVVGKHGYRLSFDDQYSAIYSTEYLYTLYQEQNERWPLYISATNSSDKSREATISFKEV